MPEIKHVFNQGKMNKDLDERLVENGQYRDAMNIQVSTSDGSDIGTVQNILGNTNVFTSNIIPPGSICIGAIPSEKDNCFYWFISHDTKNLILKYKNGQVQFVFVDTLGVLQFTNKVITAINIIDEFLFWSDGLYEPKKINIQRCIDGTDQTGHYHTKLVVPKRNIGPSSCIEVREEHITVIKKSPKTKLTLDPNFDINITATTAISLLATQVGDIDEIYFNDFPQFISGYKVGDIVILKVDDREAARIKITEILMLSDGHYKFELLSKDTDLTGSLVTYDTELQDISDLFERKFVRFGYRYKYNDGEYSSFSPFTNVVFQPDLFEYSATDAYNKAMENNLISLKLRNFITNDTPEDVVQVDILYKESDSPVVYIVDKLKYTDVANVDVNNTSKNYMQANVYEITSDLIFAVVPENQLLRTYDNVPRKAEAQELTGNRIVYGNYVQNYDVLQKPILEANYITRFVNNTTHINDYFLNSTELPVPRQRNVLNGFGQQSLKTLRSYQLGMSYLDKYNRETPIFTGSESIFNVPKKFADNKLKIESRVNTTPPNWAESFKVYIKETSTEYYNLSMSRSYKGEDGNVWLAFPSSERNKVDDETFLILKKAIDSDTLVEEEAKYKILAIDNEAPPSISTEQISIFEREISTAPTDVFGVYGPTVNSKSFRIVKSRWDAGGTEPMDQITEDLTVYIKNSLTNEYTKTYEIRSVSEEGSYYRVTLNNVFETQDAELIYPNYPTTTSSGVLDIGSDLRIVFSKIKSIAETTQFKGMFFVKINNDAIVEDNILINQSSGEYEITNTMPTHYFADAYSMPGFTGGSTGHNRSTHEGHWNSLLNRFGGSSNPLFPNNHDFSGNQIGGFFIDKVWHAGVQPGGGYSGTDQAHPSHLMGGHIFELVRIWEQETNDILVANGHPQMNDPLGTIFGDVTYRRDLIHFVWNWFNQTRGDQYSQVPGTSLPMMMIDNLPHGNTYGQPDLLQTSLNIQQPSINYVYKPQFGSGIYEDSGDHYVEIAFSEIGERTNNGSPLDSNSNVQYGSFMNTSAFDITVNQGAQVNYAKDYSATDDELKLIALNMAVGKRFKVKSDDNADNIYKILSVQKIRRYNHISWLEVQDAYYTYIRIQNQSSQDDFEELWDDFGKPTNRRIAYRLKLDHSLDDVTIDNKPITHADNIGKQKSISFQFIEPRYNTSTRQKISENPAVWETEPKESADLDIYYEASEILPLHLNSKNNLNFIPLGSTVICPSRPNTTSGLTYVVGWDNNKVTFNVPIDLNEYLPPGQSPVKLRFTRPDNSYTTIEIDVAATTGSGLSANTYIVKTNVSRNPFALSWFNCFTFNNGVESNRIRDDFNKQIIDKGVKVNTILEENYEEEKRTSGLIYSGIYNTNSGINNLNQFIQAEKITKDLNPDYGSIQKLYSRSTADGDLIAFCEDRVIKILANKDALFNADGNANLTSTNNVLGQAIPYAGEYGISNNPESFAADNYRAYFTDKQRGAVLRLSMDGLTPISEYGMSDYFKTALTASGSKLIGSFDDKKNEYNLTIPMTLTTISFKESVNGWSSFKSFVPEQALSMGNDYYTLKSGLPYKHHVETTLSGNPVDRNTFYGEYIPSSVSVLLNDSPSVIKSYKNLSYEGSQSKVLQENTDVNTGYYNLEAKPGWFTTIIKTDKQEGKVNEFIEKEGKWFNYIRGANFEDVINLRTKEFSFQGVGTPTSVSVDNSLYPPVGGCMDPRATNYNPNATIDDGSCFVTPPNNTTLVGGCMDPDAPNYNPLADYDNGSCEFVCDVMPGCTDSTALNYDPNANIDDGSCILPVYGCTSSTATNYNANANVDDGSCIFPIGGGGGGGIGTGGGGGGTGGGTSGTPSTLTVQDTNDPDTSGIPPQGS